MATFDLVHVNHIRNKAKVAYHQPLFEKNFETFWSKMICNRMDVPIPFAGYWEAYRLIQKAAWEEEVIATGEGR